MKSALLIGSLSVSEGTILLDETPQLDHLSVCKAQNICARITTMDQALCTAYRNKHENIPNLYQELSLFEQLQPEKKLCAFISSDLSRRKTCQDGVKDHLAPSYRRLQSSNVDLSLEKYTTLW